eukprot:UN05526
MTLHEFILVASICIIPFVYDWYKETAIKDFSFWYTFCSIAVVVCIAENVCIEYNENYYHDDRWIKIGLRPHCNYINMADITYYGNVLFNKNITGKTGPFGIYRKFLLTYL